MNKISLLYDVTRTMRDKDVLAGTIDINGIKDGSEAFRFNNEFSKDMIDGTTRIKITSMVDHDGKQVTHESNTEFNIDRDTAGGYSCRRHMLLHRHHANIPGGGLKEKLARLMAALRALNDMKVTEQADKSLLVSLDLKNIPEDFKAKLQEKMTARHHGSRFFPEGSYSMEDGMLQCRINKKNEIESIILNIKGKLMENNDQVHDLIFNAGISFAI